MRKNILFILLSFLSLGVYSQEQAPNIVLLFVDDLGWADVGYRNDKFHTPNIDQLKKDGLDFSRAYIATPTCSPSRASLLTGKEPVRMEMTRHVTHEFTDGTNTREFNYWEKDPVHRPSRNWLPLEEITYAEKLKELGYYNMFIGKWHLGHEPFHPIHQGFDDQYGTSNFGHPKSYYQRYFREGDVLNEIPEKEYLTDVLTDKAEAFILNYEKPQPFMLSLWYYNVHGPHVGRKDFVNKYQKEGLEGKEAEYAAMVSAMDISVGRVRKALKEKGIEENTLIIFLSDQGGLFDNAPLSGGKRGGNTLGEGGARVPFIVYYPHVTKEGTVCDTPIQSLDIYPTLVEIASGKKYTNKEINGRSILPLLEGDTIKKRSLFFFRSYENQYAAVISGDWKLVKYHNGQFDLFNLAKDIGEKNNLLGKGFKQEKRLKKSLKLWEKKAVPNFN